MNFTKEQLEKIISEAPEGAEYYTPGYDVEYRKITGQNIHYGFVVHSWAEVIDKSLSAEMINKGFNLSKLQKQLDEMKMNNKKLTVKQARDLGVVFVKGDEIRVTHGVMTVGFGIEIELINTGKYDDYYIANLAWRANDGATLRDGDMIVEVMLGGDKEKGAAENYAWGKNNALPIEKWRPHLPSLIERANKMSDSQDMQSVDSETTEPKEGEIWRGKTELGDDVCRFINGKFDYVLSGGGHNICVKFEPIERLYTQAEVDNLNKPIAITHTVGELSVTKGFDSVEDANKYEKQVELSGNTEELKNGDVVCTPLGDGVIVGASIRKSDFWWVELDDEECAHDIHKSDLSKPLTPEQKQAQIDEKNGELYFSIVCDCEKRNHIHGNDNVWDELKLDWKNTYIDLEKQIDFNGKLSA